MIYQNIVFIHIPRTGGTSIEASLGIQMGNDDKHLSASEIRAQLGEQNWQKSFVFSFVRNPWDRMVSLYHQPYFINKTTFAGQGLEHFIKNYRPAPWEKQFYHEYLDTEGIDFIGRFENRFEDLQKINKLAGLNIDPTLHQRKTDRQKDYRTYYNDTSAQLVYDLFKTDILKYGYQF